jgi:hypothetical protein
MLHSIPCSGAYLRQTPTCLLDNPISVLLFFNSHNSFQNGRRVTSSSRRSYASNTRCVTLHIGAAKLTHSPQAHFHRSPVTHASPRLPHAIAHRGFKGQYPENTILSIDGAIRAGAHALELDLHISRDGIVVLSHVGAHTPRSRTTLIDPRTQPSCAVSASTRRSATATGSI